MEQRGAQIWCQLRGNQRGSQPTLMWCEPYAFPFCHNHGSCVKLGHLKCVFFTWGQFITIFILITVEAWGGSVLNITINQCVKKKKLNHIYSLFFPVIMSKGKQRTVIDIYFGLEILFWAFLLNYLKSSSNFDHTSACMISLHLPVHPQSTVNPQLCACLHLHLLTPPPKRIVYTLGTQ